MFATIGASAVQCVIFRLCSLGYARRLRVSLAVDLKAGKWLDLLRGQRRPSVRVSATYIATG
jgi:predicted nuclease of restriction endonuclease-like (RecB) superfamily